MIIGALIGGFLAIYVLAMLWEWALFKRITDDPVVGKLSSVAAAWITGGVLGGFGLGSTESFFWPAFAIYLIPALIVGVIFYRRGLKIRGDHEDVDDIAETFR